MKTLEPVPPASAASGAFRLDLGAELRPGGVFFRVWAPKRRRVEVVLADRPASFPLSAEPGGYFSALVPEAKAGTLYRYRLDDDRDAYPDPCSRYQPQGPHGPSAVVDTAFPWTDGDWNGIRLAGQVFYELHVGTFTREGTFDAAIGELDRLAQVGITALEIMPVAEFPGRFNWGYDGVSLFAPSRVYGGPPGFKRFVDAAHARGLAVVLDVVYNHVGPDGNYLTKYSDTYFTDRYRNEWGAAVNFDGPGAAGAREFFVKNAAYWIHEYRLDGLRLDATQSLFDSGTPHVIAEIAVRAREAAAGRGVVLIGENEPQDMATVAPVSRGGHGLDAVWSDDFHHASRVALTGRREAYYSDYAGTPQEFVSLAKRGTLYHGQYYSWQKKNRGTPVTDEPGASFVFFLENHDQVANSVDGRRLASAADPALLRALTGYWLLMPGTPLFFMGQEYGSTAPFLYFADHPGELGRAVREGRGAFLDQFPTIASERSRASLADPGRVGTFSRSVCGGPASESRAAAFLGLHADLLALRRDDPVVRAQDRRGVDGAVIGENAFAVRLENRAGTRLLLVNLGADAKIAPLSEPLLAPPAAKRWKLVWTSEESRYGGRGAVDGLEPGGWSLAGRAALFYETVDAAPAEEEGPR